MSKSSDIANLFARFGGKADTYQELTTQGDVSEARNRWPLLRAIEGETGERPARTPTPAQMRRAAQAAQPVTPPVQTPVKHEIQKQPEEARAAVTDSPLERMGSMRVAKRVMPSVKPAQARQAFKPQPPADPPAEPRSPLRAFAAPSRPQPEPVVARDEEPQDRIADVFSRLASAKAKPEPVKPAGVFGSLRRLGRK